MHDYPSARRELLDDLVAERFAPVTERPASRHDGVAYAAQDSPAAVAERQRLLCAALDGEHLVAIETRGAVA